MRDQYKILAEKYRTIVKKDIPGNKYKIFEIVKRMTQTEDFNEFVELYKEIRALYPVDKPWALETEAILDTIKSAIARFIGLVPEFTPPFGEKWPPQLFFSKAIVSLLRYTFSDDLLKTKKHPPAQLIAAIESSLDESKINFNKWLDFKRKRDAHDVLYKNNPGVNIDI